MWDCIERDDGSLHMLAEVLLYVWSSTQGHLSGIDTISTPMKRQADFRWTDFFSLDERKCVAVVCCQRSGLALASGGCIRWMWVQRFFCLPRATTYPRASEANMVNERRARKSQSAQRRLSRGDHTLSKRPCVRLDPLPNQHAPSLIQPRHTPSRPRASNCHTSLTKPTSMTRSVLTPRLAILALVFSRRKRKARSSHARTKFVPGLTRICSLPMI